jgi:GNAT superfamily N-acetyltransferase
MQLGVREALSEAQIDRLVELYAYEWWTRDRSRKAVVAMLAGSDVTLALVDEAGELIAFARALTDGVFKAMIFDVIVAPAHRGGGTGDHLMHRMLEHPRLRQVRHKELYCLPEMVPFYARQGFSTDNGGVVLMRQAGAPPKGA